MKKKTRYIKRFLWDILLYSLLGCFSYFLLVRYVEIPEQHQDKLMTFQAFSAIILLFNGVGLSVRYITEKLLMYYQLYLKNHKALFIALAIAALLLFVSNYLSLVLAKLLAGLAHPFILKVNSGLQALIAVWLVEIIIVGQFMLNRFYRELVKLYKRAEELEESTAQARYMALQSQLNPHFLFNCLNTLISEIAYNPMNAIEFTQNLADTYRYILHCQNLRTVPLYEELKFLDTYLRLQKVRLGDCLELDNQIEDKYQDTPLPPLTLQLLIENVIKHNVITIGKPMNIKLASETIGQEVWLKVSNALRPKQGTVSTGKGLKNLTQRFQVLCNKEIKIEKTEKIFTVKVPLLYE